MTDTQERIFRYEIDVQDRTRMPAGVRRILSAIQHRARSAGLGYLEVWAIHTPGFNLPVYLHVRGTGDPYTGTEGRFVATVIDGPFVWHLFEGDA